MSRYIDADLMKENHLMSDDCNNCEQNPRECQHNYIYTKMDFCEWIDDEPTADVVEVVRCKDCEWWKSIFSWNGKEHKVCVRDSSEPSREQNDFCSYAERREDDER